MRRDTWLHGAIFAICLASGLLIPISVGAYRGWKLASTKQAVPANRVCAGVAEADLPDPLPAGTPFASTAQARGYLAAHAAPLRIVKEALAGPIKARHDRLIACMGIGDREHRRLRLLASWHLQVSGDRTRASRFELASIQGDDGRQRSRAAACFRQAFGGGAVTAVIPAGPFHYAGTYPAPFIVEL